jgi:hypothetical protein
MFEAINAALPTVVLIGGILLILAFIVRFYNRLPEMFEDPMGKLSNKRVGAFGFTAWVFTLLARSVEVPMEAWMLIGGLWTLKTMQRYIENGANKHNTDPE